MNDRRVHARFMPSGRTLELVAGERLLDAVDHEHALGLLPSACRAGNCGTCLVRVREGARWLEPPTAEEDAALSELGCAAGERLGCQVHVCADLPQQISGFRVVFAPVQR
jgi:ferredoxin